MPVAEALIPLNPRHWPNANNRSEWRNSLTIPNIFLLYSIVSAFFEIVFLIFLVRGTLLPCAAIEADENHTQDSHQILTSTIMDKWTYYIYIYCPYLLK